MRIRHQPCTVELTSIFLFLGLSVWHLRKPYNVISVASKLLKEQFLTFLPLLIGQHSLQSPRRSGFESCSLLNNNFKISNIAPIKNCWDTQLRKYCWNYKVGICWRLNRIECNHDDDDDGNNDSDDGVGNDDDDDDVRSILSKTRQTFISDTAFNSNKLCFVETFYAKF